MVKYCQNCGSQMTDDDSLFCSRCGTKLNSPSVQQKNEETQPLTLNEVLDIFHNLFQVAFDDLDKLDELTTIKFIIRVIENDLKQTDGFSREFRKNRISIIQGVLSGLGFDISDNTIEYLYDSIISDMDLQKMPNHKMVRDEFDVMIKKDGEGNFFCDIICHACDNNNRFQIEDIQPKVSYQWKLICPYCSYKENISQSTLTQI